MFSVPFVARNDWLATKGTEDTKFCTRHEQCVMQLHLENASRRSGFVLEVLLGGDFGFSPKLALDFCLALTQCRYELIDHFVGVVG
ncbi:hypothetical protein LF1_34610 [Rubripirellula obstinata]|uniref:Uncharacterized protein n=1 Tax=Rubripirellula obstinata TaxID=406547 RepID=A0A5B1CMB2_9BACT|nr:hypothetical protein LF1_34610 [Rubripirellula obstinata]